MDEKKNEKKGSLTRVLAVVGGVFVVLLSGVLAGGGVYIWGSSKLENQQSEYQQLEKKYDDLKIEIGILEEKLAVAEDSRLDGLYVVSDCPYSEDLVLPQVSYMAKLYYTEQDLNDLKKKVIEPIVEYYEELGQTVVSIYIDNDNRGGAVKNEFIIDVIISKNDGTDEPIYMGFIHFKSDGEIPYWEPITMD